MYPKILHEVSYRDIYHYYLDQGKLREAGYIQKYYIEKKTHKQIQHEMYYNTPGGVRRLHKRLQAEILELNKNKYFFGHNQI